MTFHTSASKHFHNLVSRFLLLIFTAICLSGLLVNPAQVLAKGSARPAVVTVGYFYDGDYYYKDENGRYRGYDLEYLYEVAKYTHWIYQFKNYESFDACLNAVYNGEVDLMPALFSNEERQQRLLLTKRDMGSVYLTLTVRSDDDRYVFNDYDGFQGMRVGVLKSGEDTRQFILWAREHQLKVQLVEKETVEELTDALRQGNIDGIAITNLGSDSHYKVVAEYSPMPLYFGLSKKRPDLLPQLENALEQISIINPRFAVNLNQKYLANTNGQKPVFTKAEQDFIAYAEPVLVVLPDHNRPFSYVDQKGQLQGALPDLLAHLSRLSGLKLQPVAAPSKEAALEMLKKGEAQAIGMILDDYSIAASSQLFLTSPIYKQTIAQVTLRDTTSVSRVGFAFGDVNYVLNNLPKGMGQTLPPHLVYDSNRECFQALAEHRVDAVYCPMTIVNYMMQNLRSENYNISIVPSGEYSVCMGVNNRANPLIYDILNTTILFTDQAFLDSQILRHSLNQSPSLLNYLSRIPISRLILGVLIVAISLLLVITALILVIRNLKAEQLHLKEQEYARNLEMELKASQKAQESRSSFFANISHDMRTPLNGILGLTDIALEAEGLPAKNAYLVKIKTSGRLLLDLVNDVLDLSKMENDKLELHRTPVVLADFLNMLVTPIQAQAVARGINFTLHKEHGPNGSVLLDREVTQKILLNLLSNAVKFTPSGGQVELTVEAVDEAGHTRFLVKDTGVGIRPEFMQHLFEPFSQDTLGRVRNQGTGLGLSIVKGLVDLCGGQISVSSALGRGSCFTVDLYLEPVSGKEPVPGGTTKLYPVAGGGAGQAVTVSGEAGAAGQAATSSTGPAEVAAASLAETKGAGPDEAGVAAKSQQLTLAGRTVLLCEDNDINAEIAIHLLKQWGLKTIRAENGQRGLELFRQSEPGDFAAVLMDVRMPVMDGYTATRMLRRCNHPDATAIPVLAMTADAYAEDVQKCLDAGMNDHVPKPIDKEVLYSKLVQLIK